MVMDHAATLYATENDLTYNDAEMMTGARVENDQRIRFMSRIQMDNMLKCHQAKRFAIGPYGVIALTLSEHSS